MLLDCHDILDRLLAHGKPQNETFVWLSENLSRIKWVRNVRMKYMECWL